MPDSLSLNLVKLQEERDMEENRAVGQFYDQKTSLIKTPH